MQLPEYVPREEVKRICNELGLKDWSDLTEPTVTDDEAAAVLRIVNSAGMKIPVEDFRQGLEVELEHGTRYDDANVTNNHPILTGKIVLAHLKESLDYYKRLEVAEIEGDLLKAILGGNPDKTEAKYRKLIAAQRLLNNMIAAQLEG